MMLDVWPACDTSMAVKLLKFKATPMLDDLFLYISKTWALSSKIKSLLPFRAKSVFFIESSDFHVFVQRQRFPEGRAFKNMSCSVNNPSLPPLLSQLSEQRELRSAYALGHHPFYEEALQMAEEGLISCRVLRYLHSSTLKKTKPDSFMSFLCDCRWCWQKDLFVTLLCCFLVLVIRTEMLGCLGDEDFLAKLHCVRQACQVVQLRSDSLCVVRRHKLW